MSAEQYTANDSCTWSGRLGAWTIAIADSGALTLGLVETEPGEAGDGNFTVATQAGSSQYTVTETCGGLLPFGVGTYTATATGLTFEEAPTGLGGTSVVSHFALVGNVVFVADQAPVAGNFGGVAGANAICAAAASGAGLAGNYLAWLSDSNGNSPSTRFTPLTTPYTLVDGTPIASDWAGLVSGTLDNPIDEDPSGAVVQVTSVWTGTNSDGTPSGNDCGSWTARTPDYSGGTGSPASATSLWTAAASTGCNNPVSLYCFQQGNVVFLAPTNGVAGDLGGVAGGDSICQDAATSAGLTGTFRAWLSDSNGNSPASRFTRLTTPYTLVDGTPIAASYAGLVGGTLENPIDEDVTGARQDPAGVWTGTNADGTAATSNCDNWTSSLVTVAGVVGVNDETTYEWTDASSPQCTLVAQIICVQQ